MSQKFPPQKFPAWRNPYCLCHWDSQLRKTLKPEAYAIKVRITILGNDSDERCNKEADLLHNFSAQFKWFIANKFDLILRMEFWISSLVFLLSTSWKALKNLSTNLRKNCILSCIPIRKNYSDNIAEIPH